MSYSIITYGFGPNGSVNAIPVYGFFNSGPYLAPLVDIEVTSKVVRSISFISKINQSYSFESKL